MRYRASRNLKSDEAYRLAKALAERTGRSMTPAVIAALRDGLAKTEQRPDSAAIKQRILAITKGCRSGQPARLNFAGCFAYAPARAAGEPLLFTPTSPPRATPAMTIKASGALGGAAPPAPTSA